MKRTPFPAIVIVAVLLAVLHRGRPIRCYWARPFGAYPGAKVVPGVFNTVRAAVALPKGRSAATRARLVEIITEAKRFTETSAYG
jgi:hypothetical protein